MFLRPPRLITSLIIALLTVGVGPATSAISVGAAVPASHPAKKKACKGKKKRDRKGCKRSDRQPEQQPGGWPQDLGSALSSGGPLQIHTTPPLYPAFDADVSDYVTRCDGTDPVSVSVSAPGLLVAAIDGSAPTQGTFTASVPLDEGQEFAISAQWATYSRTFHIRCLPTDFPSWNFERFGQPNNEFYMAEPNIWFAPPTDSMRYSIVWDDRGVPIWWFHSSGKPIDSKVLSNGTIAFNPSASTLVPYEIRGLDGTLIDTVGIVGGSTDVHDLQERPNGNYLVLEDRQRPGADLTSLGGPPSASVIDAVIQEVDPSGNLVWEWNSKDHIGAEETGRWYPSLIPTGPPYDLAHINSVEPDGDSLIISLRHTDAVYKIDRATGSVIWKLGGIPTPQSLQVLGDPYGDYPFGGQHDARLQPDGTVSLHDNATDPDGDPAHEPRAVRYAIDENAMTATLVESVNDPDVTGSLCCGGARRSPSGSWVMSWGANSLVTEFDSAGTRTFRLTFPDSVFSYRAFPVPPGQLTRSALRAGMDAQYPRP